MAARTEGRSNNFDRIQYGNGGGNIINDSIRGTAIGNGNGNGNGIMNDKAMKHVRRRSLFGLPLGSTSDDASSTDNESTKNRFTTKSNFSGRAGTMSGSGSGLGSAGKIYQNHTASQSLTLLSSSMFSSSPMLRTNSATVSTGTQHHYVPVSKALQMQAQAQSVSHANQTSSNAAKWSKGVPGLAKVSPAGSGAQTMTLHPTPRRSFGFGRDPVLFATEPTTEDGYESASIEKGGAVGLGREDSVLKRKKTLKSRIAMSLTAVFVPSTGRKGRVSDSGESLDAVEELQQASGKNSGEEPKGARPTETVRQQRAQRRMLRKQNPALAALATAASATASAPPPEVTPTAATYKPPPYIKSSPSISSRKTSGGASTSTSRTPSITHSGSITSRSTSRSTGSSMNSMNMTTPTAHSFGMGVGIAYSTDSTGGIGYTRADTRSRSGRSTRSRSTRSRATTVDGDGYGYGDDGYGGGGYVSRSPTPPSPEIRPPSGLGQIADGLVEIGSEEEEKWKGAWNGYQGGVNGLRGVGDGEGEGEGNDVMRGEDEVIVQPRPNRISTSDFAAILSGRAYTENYDASNTYTQRTTYSPPPVAAPPPPRRRLPAPLQLSTLLSALPALLPHLPQTTLCSLALTSRRIGVLASRELYASLSHLSILPLLRQSLLETLASNATIASYVRHFEWSARVASTTGAALLRSTLRNMVNLEELRIELRSRDAGILWEVGAREGRLKSLSIDGLVTAEAAETLAKWLDGRRELKRLECPDVFWLPVPIGVPPAFGPTSGSTLGTGLISSGNLLSPIPRSPISYSRSTSRSLSPIPLSPVPSSPPTPIPTSPSSAPDPASSTLPSLPNLAHFVGTPSLAALLAPARPLKSVTLLLCTTIYDGLRPGVLMADLTKSGCGGGEDGEDSDGIEEIWLEMTEKVCEERRTVTRVLSAVGGRLGESEGSGKKGLKCFGIGWKGKRSDLYEHVSAFLAHSPNLKLTILKLGRSYRGNFSGDETESEAEVEDENSDNVNLRSGDANVTPNGLSPLVSSATPSLSNSASPSPSPSPSPVTPRPGPGGAGVVGATVTATDVDTSTIAWPSQAPNSPTLQYMIAYNASQTPTQVQVPMATVTVTPTLKMTTLSARRAARRAARSGGTSSSLVAQSTDGDGSSLAQTPVQVVKLRKPTERELVDNWRIMCPTLRRVEFLSGKVWTYENEGKGAVSGVVGIPGIAL